MKSSRPLPAPAPAPGCQLERQRPTTDRFEPGDLGGQAISHPPVLLVQHLLHGTGALSCRKREAEGALGGLGASLQSHLARSDVRAGAACVGWAGPALTQGLVPGLRRGGGGLHEPLSCEPLSYLQAQAGRAGTPQCTAPQAQPHGPCRTLSVTDCAPSADIALRAPGACSEPRRRRPGRREGPAGTPVNRSDQ